MDALSETHYLWLAISVAAPLDDSPSLWLPLSVWSSVGCPSLTTTSFLYLLFCSRGSFDYLLRRYDH